MLPQLLTTLLLFAASPVGEGATDDSNAPIAIEAERVEYEDDLLHAEGNVTARQRALVLRAEQLDYDTVERSGEAEGRIVVVEGNVVIRARRATFSLLEEQLELEDVELFSKLAPCNTERLLTLPESGLREEGRNALLLRADDIVRTGPNRYRAEGARLTPCDCAVPDYELTARSADIEPGEGAILYWSMLRVKEVPVLPLPLLYLPLSERRTGFLVPRWGQGTNSGFYLEEPFFLVLGRSWDTTFTPGYWFGGNEEQRPNGMKGFYLREELRYAPHESTRGRVELTQTWDENNEPSTRHELRLRHVTSTDAGLEVNAGAHLYSDTALAYTARPVLTILPYTRSQLRAGYRGDDLSINIGSGWLQPLDSARKPLFGGSDSPVLEQRPLVLDVAVPSLALSDDLRAGFELMLLHTRAMGPFGASVAEQAPGSLALTRIAANPRAELSLSKSAVRAELFVGARAESSTFQGLGGAVEGSGPLSDESLVAGGLYGGGRATATLSRAYGSGKAALLHLIEPSIEVHAVSPWLGDAVLPQVAPQDEFTARHGDELELQSIAALQTRFVTKGGTQPLRLVVGQGVELLRGTLADTFARLELRRGVFGGELAAQRDAVSRGHLLTAAVSLSSEFATLSVAYDEVSGLYGTGRTRAAYDELFSLRLPGAIGQGEAYANQLRPSLTLRPTSWVELVYSARYDPSTSDVLRPGMRKFISHYGAVTLSSQCQCWRVGAFGTYCPAQVGVPQPPITFGLLLELSGLGFGGI